MLKLYIETHAIQSLPLYVLFTRIYYRMDLPALAAVCSKVNLIFVIRDNVFKYTRI